ncbi:MAG: gliding motility-associated C-terminal domain-containing protein, partial [Cyclobacteriaceae bacterium]
TLPLVNEITWTTPLTPSQFGGPRNDIELFKVYRKQGADSFEVIDTIIFSIDSTLLDSFLVADREACYVVTAVDEKGNESAFSEEVCIENCSDFSLPNIFTPNGDGLNEQFMPLNSLFVETLHIVIVNRWGITVFESDEPDFSWNGDNVTDGTYFYQYDVVFKGSGEKDSQKGFITIKR